MERWLRVLWMFGGWIRPGFPSVAAVIDGVVGSRNWTCWGVTPVDVRPPMVFAIATPTKASVRWGSSGS